MKKIFDYFLDNKYVHTYNSLSPEEKKKIFKFTALGALGFGSLIGGMYGMVDAGADLERVQNFGTFLSGVYDVVDAEINSNIVKRTSRYLYEWLSHYGMSEFITNGVMANRAAEEYCVAKAQQFGSMGSIFFGMTSLLLSHIHFIGYINEFPAEMENKDDAQEAQEFLEDKIIEDGVIGYSHSPNCHLSDSDSP